MRNVSPVIPTLRYRDAHRAISFLVDAFGFVRNAVHESDERIEHAQLMYGSGMVMLASERPDDLFSDLRPSSIYVIVADADEHCAQATAQGAEIIMAVEDQDYGGRVYTAKDPEGNLWSFGTYTPDI